MNGHPITKSWLTAICMAGFLCILFACGGTKKTTPANESVDTEFFRTNRAARIAFESGRISQAISLYRKALERAYVLDDLNAVVDTRYNLAVCQLTDRAYSEALEEIEKYQAELQLAGRSPPVDLLLIEAVARYKIGELDQAWQITERLKAAQPAPTPQTLSEAGYLRGMIAADRGKAAQLRIAISALGQPTTPRFEADLLELTGRLAMIEERFDDAAAALDEAARLRSESGDYRSMVSILAMAAQSCEKAQRPGDAAYLYLRAARGALSDGDKTRAADWLSKAVRLARQVGSDAILKEAREYQSILADEKKMR